MKQQCSSPLAAVQAAVLHGGGFHHVRHLLLHFEEGRCAHPLLSWLLQQPWTLAAEGPGRAPPEIQASIGFTAEGLKRLDVPRRVLVLLGDRAPAFCAGASARAARLGDSGASAAAGWEPAFRGNQLHAVLTLQSADPSKVTVAQDDVEKKTTDSACRVLDVLHGDRLGPPQEYVARPDADRQHWVHFGYRDALSRVFVRGWDDLNGSPPGARHDPHAAGEFVLGHAQDSGADPWSLPNATAEVRAFFRDGSFGVLRKIEQDVQAFEDFVTRSASEARKQLKKWGDVAKDADPPPAAARAWIKAKLMGRWPAGMPLLPDQWEEPTAGDPETDHDYHGDSHGHGCPFGSHARRMNTREPVAGSGAGGSGIVHALRHRPLIRRGVPYGSAWQPGDETRRGLLGMFFCASLEDQFEHLVGQWAATVPLGSEDTGNAADLFVARQSRAMATFAIPLPDVEQLRLRPLPDCVRTRGTAYLFYPGIHGLGVLARQGDWRPEPGPTEVP